MFKAIERRRARNKEIARLRNYIHDTYSSETKNAKTPKEKGEAYQIAHSICEFEEDELEYLRQEEVLDKLTTAPFEVPEEYWQDIELGHRKVLTSRGMVWVQNELKKVRRASIEFWFKLILPLLALVISIIALLRKH